MPQFRMLLVEELIESDSGEFRINAATEEDAARVLIDAHDAARARDSSVIRLADGQTRRIEPDNIVRNRVFCVLLDDSGAEIREVDPASRRADSNIVPDVEGAPP